MSKYRKNVAAFILNDDGKLLICLRSDKFKTWQLPQGGIDEGETPREALYRELLEEIGTNNIDIIHELEDRIRYDWPEHLHTKKHVGQEQVYFLVKLNSKIDLEAASSKEFIEAKWIDSKTFSELDCGFKTEAYNTALSKLLKLFPNLIK